MRSVIGKTLPVGAEVSRVFYLGDWLVNPGLCRIQLGEQVTKLEPRVMQVLVFLARDPGEVVTREQIQAGVWGNRIVGYEALGRAVAQLRKALGDDPKHPKFIETLSKQGYRLIAPVRRADTAVRSAPDRSGGDSDTSDDNPAGSKPWMLAALLVLAVAAVGLALRTASMNEAVPLVTEAPEPASIVILPFVNLSSDPQQSHVADGISDNLITELTKVPGLLVIARYTAFSYKGRSPDVASLTQELGVRYVLEGSVQREAGRLRINAQLTETDSGNQVWAQRYDGGVEDIFGLQDRITRDVVLALSGDLHSDEVWVFSPRDTRSFEAYEYFLRGRERYYRFSHDDNQAARSFYRKAIDIDPGFARAYAMLALTYRQEAVNGWSTDHGGSLEQAMALADKAIALNKKLPEAYFVKGLVHRERKEFVEAIVAAEKAIEIDPNYADGYVVLGSVLYMAGRPEEGLRRVEKAMRLNPHYPHNYQLCQGQALYVMGSYDEAIDAFTQGLERYPESERLHVWLAAAHAQVGNAEDAQWEMGLVKSLNPEFSSAYLEQASAFQYQTDLDSFLEGVERAMRLDNEAGAVRESSAQANNP